MIEFRELDNAIYIAMSGRWLIRNIDPVVTNQ